MAVTKNKMSIVVAQFEKRSHWFHDKGEQNERIDWWDTLRNYLDEGMTLSKDEK